MSAPFFFEGANMILNLTQHNATAEQKAVGVVEPHESEKADIKRCLTFDVLPSTEEIRVRARRLAGLALSLGATCAVIEGAPFLMGELERALITVGIQPVYAFTSHEEVAQEQSDRAASKNAGGRHLGFIPAATRPDTSYELRSTHERTIHSAPLVASFASLPEAKQFRSWLGG